MPPESVIPPGSARLVVLGSAGLASGFSLIGAEVHVDADPADGGSGAGATGQER